LVPRSISFLRPPIRAFRSVLQWHKTQWPTGREGKLAADKPEVAQPSRPCSPLQVAVVLCRTGSHVCRTKGFKCFAAQILRQCWSSASRWLRALIGGTQNGAIAALTSRRPMRLPCTAVDAGGVSWSVSATDLVRGNSPRCPMYLHCRALMANRCLVLTVSLCLPRLPPTLLEAL